jgi:hypothetical protein
MSNIAVATTPVVNTSAATTPVVNTPIPNTPVANTIVANTPVANTTKVNNTKVNNTSLNNNLNNLDLNSLNLNNLNNLTNNNTKNKSKNTPTTTNTNTVMPSKNNIGNTMTNIKNQILGTDTNNNTTKNKSKKNNADNSSSNNNTTTNNRKNKNNKYTDDEDESSISYTIGKVVIMIIVLVILFYVSKYLLVKYTSSGLESPFLLSGSKNAKYALVLSQDPASINYTPIKQSEEKDGIQFTYSFWFLLEGFDYKKGEWKHMFHKGNASSYPNRAPGVWLHPNKNDIRVYMNTLDNIMEYADVENLPTRKWIYMSIVLNNKNLDLYVNGYLKIRKELSSLPKQNNDDFWVTMFGGFEGYISNIRYYAYAIDFNEMNTNIKSGPSIDNCIDTGEVPPYLDDNWWFNYNI